MADEADTEKPIAAADVVRMLLACQPTVIDEPSIRQVLGSSSVRTLSEIAKIFGKSYTTVKTAWRPSGMPCDSKGRFMLADILIWWLRREDANRDARGRDELADRKRVAEVTKAEFEARAKQREFERQEGQWIQIELARSQWNAGLGILSNDIMGMPRDIKPMLCKKCVLTAGPEVERQLRLHLTRMSERQISDLEVNGNGQGQNGSDGINGHNGAGEAPPR